MEKEMRVKCEIYRDSMQNYKKYGIPKAQLTLFDLGMERIENDGRGTETCIFPMGFSG